jgi:hypothetical protein
MAEPKDVASYLTEQMSDIENHAKGNDIIQLMVSVDGKSMKGKNYGEGDRLNQAGGHYDSRSLQLVSQNFTQISTHQTEIKKHTGDTLSESKQETTTTTSKEPFSGQGFTLTPKPS